MTFKKEVFTKELEHFSSIPWVASHINTPGFILCPMRSRKAKASNEDSFFSATLQTPQTLVHHLSICKAESLPVPASVASSSSDASLPPIRECKTFYTLGTGLDGYPQVAHGGLLATLLDEQMGLLLVLNGEFGSPAGAKSLVNAMTVYLNVRYKAPVKTPGTLMATAVCTKKDRRKTFIRAAVVDESGKECAIGEGMFLDVPEVRL